MMTNRQQNHHGNIEKIHHKKPTINYNIKNSRFIIHLYDLNADDYISDQMLDDFDKAHDQDQTNK